MRRIGLFIRDKAPDNMAIVLGLKPGYVSHLDFVFILGLYIFLHPTCEAGAIATKSPFFEGFYRVSKEKARRDRISAEMLGNSKFT